MTRGWKFPVEIDPQTGKFKMVEDDQDIRESIQLILTTRIGERIGNPHFGSNVFEFLFTTINYTELKELEYEIIQALNRWEPRIRDLEVDASADPTNKGKINIVIQYRTEQSIIPEEMAFDFEVNEGMNIRTG
ncbi:GPW/gp25 family protein [Heliorestis acidaminivorans]|uniref:GPW/gp25 family protein n=1 Tax=Heliorestis acidaminivorans TaxID=553427 RepID=A0A6I0F1B3_9FIRM|nr:GPW/gp25 family protein [Heliorestis acidaminivorans]KAB2951949.1 GPW/gp25 family protein [Heliorestis acidaminivorans]